MRPARFGGYALLLAAAVAVTPLARTLEARAPAGRPGIDAAPILPRAAVLRPLLLGFHPVAADLYWLRTIQYFGEQMQSDGEMQHLAGLVTLVTDLDPAFLDAFQLGGLFLAIAKRYPEAIRIYEAGIRAHPDRWELPYELGRLYFLDLRDDARALAWWQVADRLPGRPEYLPRFLARLHARTGALQTALELWTALHETAGNEWVRKTARREIQKLLAELRARGGASR